MSMSSEGENWFEGPPAEGGGGRRWLGSGEREKL